MDAVAQDEYMFDPNQENTDSVVGEDISQLLDFRDSNAEKLGKIFVDEDSSLILRDSSGNDYNVQVRIGTDGTVSITAYSPSGEEASMVMAYDSISAIIGGQTFTKMGAGYLNLGKYKATTVNGGLAFNYGG